jgi:hypothetical protein
MWEGSDLNINDTIIFEDKFYQLLGEEQIIYTPDLFKISATWEKDKDFQYISTYEIKEHQLYLKNMTISSDRGFPVINEIRPQSVYNEKDIDTVLYENLMETLKYTGGILIGCDYIKNYNTRYDLPYFLYGKLYELVFEDGKLITTIDHSKAMLRIRKNLDLGLRNLDKERDRKCIKHFLKTSFIGDYMHPGRKGKKKLKNIIQYVSKIKSLTPFS